MEDNNSPETWYRNLPPVTKWVVTGTFCLTLGFVLGLVQPSLLLLDWHLVNFPRLQIWRLITNYLFIGPFSFQWLIHMYLFTQFSTKLEQSELFTQDRSSYFTFILYQMLALDVLSLILFYPIGRPILGPALLFSIIYYWSRREPWAQVGLWGFSIQAYQFPFALMFIDILMGNSIWFDILGLLTGHLYYFVREILPHEGGPDLLSKPPAVLESLMYRLTVGSSEGAHVAGRRAGGGMGSGGPPPPPGGGPREFSGRGYRLGGD